MTPFLWSLPSSGRVRGRYCHLALCAVPHAIIVQWQYDLVNHSRLVVITEDVTEPSPNNAVVVNECVRIR